MPKLSYFDIKRKTKVISFFFILLTGKTDEPNAQANPIGSTAGSGVSDDNYVLVRRYVPSFVGKREPSQAEIENADTDNLKNTLDKDNSLNDYVKDLLEYYDYLENNDLTSSVDEDFYVDNNESNDDEENENDDQSIDTQEDKRYVPSFVGKRKFTPMFVGKRYQPRFVGKRYRPMFIGKRYNPLFVGKRYRPMFIGKRYQPRFVGKRYQPRFVGKRYTPQFVGKRYTPQFVGKRFTPQFVGKRYTPQFVGKRYQPKFIGKRYQPLFVGKKSSPTPMFVGKRSEFDDIESSLENGHIEKRSVDTENTEEKINDAETDKNTSRRRKRSVLIGMNPIEKRFVAPEFIGRRDSLSSILSALDALQFARESSRSTTKRFEAPLFIGKRMRPLFVGKRTTDNVNEMATDRDFEFSPRHSEFNMGAYDRIPEDFYPYGEMYSSIAGFPIESGKL